MSAPNCHDCKHYRMTMVFDLCDHSSSTYTAAGKIDQHTVGHMRRWACGEEGRLFEPTEVRRGT